MTDLARWRALCKMLVDDGHMTPVAQRQILRLAGADAIEQWHALPDDDARELHRYLGLTWPEYQAAVKRGEL